MWKNYFVTAVRHVRREKGYAAINVAGLAIGMACCLLIMLFIRSELSYDRFHENADRIVRIVREESALSAAPIGPALENDLAEVESSVRLLHETNVVVRRSDGEMFRESIWAADSTFFDVFDFELLAGDRVLRRPDELVISRSMAEKYFGDENPIGGRLTVDAGGEVSEAMTFTVSGVMEDVPAASHFDFDLLASFELVSSMSGRMDNWSTNWLFTYLLLNEGADAEGLEAKLPTFFERHVGERWNHFMVQPLLDIHLYSAHLEYDVAPQGDIRQIALFAVIAVLVLLIACINFINLSTARAMRRAREVGVRKVLGARRRQLVGQFLGESMVVVGGAVVVAVGLVYAGLPVVRSIAGRELVLAASEAGFLAAALGVLVLVVGLVAGSYPALFLSGFEPVRTLGARIQGSLAGGTLRKSLVVVQFSVSIFLIVGTVAVHRQLEFVRSARLGFEPAQTLLLPLGGALEGRSDLVKQEIQSLPNVVGVSAAWSIPGRPVSDFLYRPEGWTREDLPGWDTFFIDEDYADVLDLNFALGRDFASNRSSDSSAFLLNESAWEAIRAQEGDAWSDPIGKQLDFYVPGDDQWEVAKSGPVIGIVEDFHYRSLHSPIGPLVLQTAPGFANVVLVKVGTEDLTATIEGLRERWTALAGEAPFEIEFLDATFDRLYRSEERMRRFAGIFAALAILVACLGLFGLSTFMADRRTKEIGIRKVLGASVGGIVKLLSAEYLKLVAAAFVLAVPVSYLVVDDWLEAFAYRIDLGAGTFALAGAVALLIAAGAVSYQSVRAAVKDPVNSLRYE